MLMVAPRRYTRSANHPPSQPPFHPRQPSLRMHGLGELLAFCLEFKKFFRLPLSSRPDPGPRRTTLTVVTYLFRYVSRTPTRAPTLDSVP